MYKYTIQYKYNTRDTKKYNLMRIFGILKIGSAIAVP